jgi:hypothetical protein
MKLASTRFHLAGRFWSKAYLFLIFTTVMISDALCDLVDTYSVKEAHKLPYGWTLVRAAAPQHELHLHIGLKQNLFHELEQHLIEGGYSSPRLVHNAEFIMI